MTLFQDQGTEPEIILLDYQATLVKNFAERQQWMAINKGRPYHEWIPKEQFRENIIKACEGKHVILITARPAKYGNLTMRMILEKTGWQPNEAYFNEYGERPDQCKLRILQNTIYPKHGRGSLKYLALESNEQTRKMYAKQGIAAVRWNDSWTELPKIGI
jgi:hypothetical protein